MIQLFIPTALIVILSWMSFWINIEAAPARTSLGVTTVLMITTQTSNSRSSLPKVSYVKALDIWMATCLLFVFAALLEYAVVNFLSRQTKMKIKEQYKRKRREDKKQYQQKKLDTKLFYEALRHRSTNTSGQANIKSKKAAIRYFEELKKQEQEKMLNEKNAKNKNNEGDIHAFKAVAKRIDKRCRILFPGMFFMFNAYFWSTYKLFSTDLDKAMEGAISYTQVESLSS